MANNITTTEKLPPQNLEAEESFLGSLLIDKDAIIKVADIINEKDFYRDNHRLIFETMKELYSRQEPIDILSLTNRLEEKNHLEKIGGRTYLAHLSNVTATSANVSHYAQIIQRKATLRRLLNTASEIAELFQGFGDPSGTGIRARVPEASLRILPQGGEDNLRINLADSCSYRMDGC